MTRRVKIGEAKTHLLAPRGTRLLMVFVPDASAAAEGVPPLG